MDNDQKKRRKISQEESTSDQEYVKVSDGYLIVRQMKDDNSCLFSSIGYVLNQNAEKNVKLRQEVKDYVLSDPVNYNDAILGKSVNDYIEWILKPNSWYSLKIKLKTGAGQ